MDPTEGRVEEYRGADAFEAGTGDPHAFDDRTDGQQAPEGTDPFADEQYEVPEPPVTGDEVVDEAARRVAAAARQSLDVQVGVYDSVHRALQDRLADVED